MRWQDYLIDRLPILLSFTGGIVFLLIISFLVNDGFRLGDASYILFLFVLLSALIFGVDYFRQRKLRSSVEAELNADQDPLRPPAVFPAPATREQTAFLGLLEKQQRHFDSQLRSLRAAGEEHRTFIDHWVHQMKTPLSVIELSAQNGLREGAVSTAESGEGELWESVSEEAQHLSDGLDLILANARLAGFELDLRPNMVDLVEVSRSVLNDSRRWWIRSGVYPKLVAPEWPVNVETDSKWLEVMLRQLLSNALKYSIAKSDVPTLGADDASGEGSSFVVTIRVTVEGEKVFLTVEDEGIGIPEHDLPRVFERFFTGDNGRRTRASTGVGLYLVAEVCRRLGHTLLIGSREGVGTKVSIGFASRTLHDGVRKAGESKLTRA